MRYETPEVVEIGAAEELTLGSMGPLVDSECYTRTEDGGEVSIGLN
jgi:hypothetical protein